LSFENIEKSKAAVQFKNYGKMGITKTGSSLNVQHEFFLNKKLKRLMYPERANIII